MESRALFTHCHGHSLNLAVCDTIKKCKLTRDVLDVTHEISKLVKFSPKRNAIFDKIKEELSPDTPSFRVLCPTRWTVRAKSLQSVIDNYAVLQQLWDCVLDSRVDPDVRARVIGVQAQMETFDYYFGVCLGKMVLSHADNLSATLQKSSLSAAESHRIAVMTVETIVKMRTDECFDLFWESVKRNAGLVHVAEPRLPRRRRMPQRYETGTATAHFHATVENHYRQIYFEILDYATSTIKERFDQPSYTIYHQTEDLLIKSASGEDYSSELAAVADFYSDDIKDKECLVVQLKSLETLFEGQRGVDFRAIVKVLKSYSVAEREIFSEVMTLVKLVLINPATNAISERSFSAMRRLKTYLRSTMGQKRLNAIMLLHVYKDMTDKLSVIEMANQFCTTEHRQSVFGSFSEKDL